MPVFKIVWNDEIRRCTFVGEPTIDLIYTLVSAMLDVSFNDVAMRYIDSDGDIVTLGSERELAIAFADFAQRGRIPKFIVKYTTSSMMKEVPTEDTETSTNEKGEMKRRRSKPRGCRGSGKGRQAQQAKAVD